MKSKVEIRGNGQSKIAARRDFTIFTWNIGYAGLGKEMDFFYDGGKKCRPEKTQCSAYFNGIKGVIKENTNADFMFFQEVDLDSKRAWYQDQYLELLSILPSYYSGFAINYDCRFVPMPLLDPMGPVKAGLVTFSTLQPDAAMVQYFRSDFPWPTRLVMLKRCYMLFRFRLDNGKDLVLVNLHNSAYDSTGSLRTRELKVLDSLLKNEYQQGNYILAGGDWNSNPRGFNIHSIREGDKVVPIDPPMQDFFLQSWSYVYDTLHPSNRFTDIPYLKGETRTTTIDFFVVSPNIEVKNVVTAGTGFQFSDHEPVVMVFRLK